MKKGISSRVCNLCGEKMTGGIAGFIQHGGENHPDYFLSGVEAGDNLKFSPKKYWCPVDQRWYSTTKWLSRNLKKHGWTNEQYYNTYGREHMPDVWSRNCGDPVLGDAHNHNKCIQCGKTVKFHDTHWEYAAFCGFKCSTKWYADNTDRPQRAMETLKERQKDDPTLRLTPTQLDYWIVKHGMTVEEAREKVRERQQTNTLERFIARADGDEDEGRRRWVERQEKWMNSLDERGWFGNHSEVSKRLFTELQQRTGLDLRFGENELSIRAGGRVFKPDCAVQGTKKIIEFFGDYWHANPAKYEPTDVIRRLNEGNFVVAQEIWNRDQVRLENLKEHGFDVKVVWEADYVAAPAAIIQDCLGFLTP